MIVRNSLVYSNILGCEERGEGKTSIRLDFFGNQLTLHEVEGYRAGTLTAPAPNFGAILDSEILSVIIARLNDQGYRFNLSSDGTCLQLEDPSGHPLALAAGHGRTERPVMELRAYVNNLDAARRFYGRRGGRPRSLFRRRAERRSFQPDYRCPAG